VRVDLADAERGKAMKRVLLVLAALALPLLFVPPAAAVTGTWEQYPMGAASYEAQIQQPINGANTSNWSSKSKGGIPVMWKIMETSGPAVFQSTEAQPYSYEVFTPGTTMTFADITNLSVNYAFDEGDCHGGSLRWTVNVQHEASSQNLHVYYGEPNGPDQGCVSINNGSGLNLISDTTLPVNRFEIQGGGSPVYIPYTSLSAYMGDTVNWVGLIIDSGWGGDQVLTISDTMVNDSVYQWQSGGGDPVAVCPTELAYIDVRSLTGDPTGGVNEEPVQASLADTNDQYRIIDCKYQYVLSIPSLAGAGHYSVAIDIGGDEVGLAYFDLK
jgi:hypothetical protein